MSGNTLTRTRTHTHTHTCAQAKQDHTAYTSTTGGAKGTFAWKAPELFEEDDDGNEPENTRASDVYRYCFSDFPKPIRLFARPSHSAASLFYVTALA